MSNIIKSASKIILLIFGLSASAGFLAVVFSNLKSQEIVMAVIALYSGAVSSVMTYYFTKRAVKPGDKEV